MSSAASSGGVDAAAIDRLLHRPGPSMGAHIGELHAAEMQVLATRLEVVAVLSLGDGASFDARGAVGGLSKSQKRAWRMSSEPTPRLSRSPLSTTRPSR